MTDRQPTPGKEGRVYITPEDGSPPYYATLSMADAPLAEGSPINKATLLSDDTAALLEHPDTPNEALAWLGRYNQHWWKRRTYARREVVEIAPQKNDVQMIVSDSPVKIVYYAQAVSVSDGGTVSLVLPNSAQISHPDWLPTLGNHYFTVADDRQVYYSPTPVEYHTEHYSEHSATSIKACRVTGAVAFQRGSWENLRSSARSAYPDFGVQQGYEYHYLDVPFTNAVNAPRMAFGSYTGTGHAGSDKRNAITFDFIPRGGLILPSNASSTYVFAWTGGSCAAICGISSLENPVVVSGNTFQWHSTQGAQYQCNLTDVVYFYMFWG